GWRVGPGGRPCGPGYNRPTSSPGGHALARVAPVVDPTKLADLKQKALESRRLIVEAINHAKAGHLGGPLSVTDILVSLYFDVARVDPAKPRDPNRDRIIL